MSTSSRRLVCGLARTTSTKKHPTPSEPGEFERTWTQPARGFAE